MLGAELVKDPAYAEVHEDGCLCQIDVPASVSEQGWLYEEMNGDTMDVHIWKESP
jgi:hypothetical protein